MSDNAHSRSFIYYLFLTALSCGAMVMVIEVLGSKVIGPVFGVSLFVWTSLITVTLVALSAGYAAGGYVSDKKDSPDYLYGIIFLAGLLVLLVPFMKSIILRLCQPLGLRMGALTSSTILFGPSLFLLGCVSPYIIKVSARELRNIGRTVGVFYSISTVGSFLGTIMTGFFLIAYFGVSRIFEVVGILLVLLAVIYFLIFRKKVYVLAALIVPFVLFSADDLTSFTLSNGTRVIEVLHKDTFYGQLNVIDYTYGPKHYRELLIDGQVQGGIDMGRGLSILIHIFYSAFHAE
jgi:MFS family permease